MSAPSVDLELSRLPRFGSPRSLARLTVELHETSPGDVRQPVLDDHHVSVHSGTPVRVSCHGGRLRCLKTRGEITVMPAGSSDDWLEDDASSAIDLRLPRTLVRRVASELGLDPDRASLEARCQVKDAQLEHIAWALEAEHRAGFPGGVLYTDALATALTVRLLAHYRAPASSTGQSLSRRQLLAVTEHIEAHLDRPLSLDELAQVAGIGTSHFKQLFKRTLGLPPHTYVIQRRVERARSLLQQGELPASQVAMIAGFAHQSHMARAMRRQLGVTPSTFTAPRRQSSLRARRRA